MEHSTEVLYNRTKVYCTPAHRFGSDALLLARFCEPKRSQTAADLCSDCGIVALEWHDRGHRGPCAALELQPEGSALLADAVTEQSIGHITPHCADLRTFRQGEGSFDVCACNPPYFTDGPQSRNAAHALARHENTCTLDDVCGCAFRLDVCAVESYGRFSEQDITLILLLFYSSLFRCVLGSGCYGARGLYSASSSQARFPRQPTACRCRRGSSLWL